MADEFPDTHETKTTTTTTATTTTVCTFNEAYVKSMPGLLRIAQIIIGLVFWIVLVCNRCPTGFAYILTIALLAWIFTIILFVLFVFMITDRISINWPVTEFINDALWGVLHAIGAILLFVSFFQSRCFGIFYGIFIFDFILSAAVTVLYLFQAFIAFRDGAIEFRSQSSGATGQT